MATLNIADPRAIDLAAKVARKTGESVDNVILRSLEELVARECPVASGEFDHDLYEDLVKLTNAALPVVDKRSSDEILGYGESGAF